jgi:hypothetical protein
MFIAHGPLSVVLNEVVQKKEISNLTKGEHITVVMLSFFFGILPDFDILALSMTNIPPFLHHQVFTHSVLFWVLMWLMLYLCIYILKRISNSEVKRILNSKVISVIQFSFLIGVLSHLFADVLLSYSQILFPLKTEITIFGGILTKNYFSGYLYSPSMALEGVILGVFLLFLYKSFLKENNILKYILFTLIGGFSLLFCINTYMNLNTYNNTHYRQEGKIVYDQDYDSLLDYNDPDIDNDGRNNLIDVNRSNLVKSVYEILESEKLTTNKGESLWENIKYRYGALNSYRLISQAFLDQNKPIEPVLKIYAQQEYEIEGYVIDEKYEDVLFSYFEQRKLFRDLTRRNIPGKLLFVVDEVENKLINIGVFLNGNEVGIVLPTDNRTKVHTMEELVDYYPEYTLRTQR